MFQRCTNETEEWSETSELKNKKKNIKKKEVKTQH